ncbi:hypothetical protein [Arenibacter sp. F20364]|uniref:hypothetical protein n=1 Tax=Arenibacter sp. F20364 TaxID=2926415 RepID=UPI001FF12D11|nr:hypothetical protein [Arenibacter sp. F20364]MCK0188889.1 hypothetical protein [Arenibacter sp. F20364]
MIGIPIGWFLLLVYVFGILLGHLVASQLITHYWDKKKEWKFWQIVFIALGTVVLIRLATLIPFLGTLVPLWIIVFDYGAFLLVFLKRKKEHKTII